jgi:succinate dehydrogenase hydrophobic anchor subunit
MTDDHPAPTVNHPTPIGDHPDPISNPNLPYLTPEAPDIDIDFPSIDYTIITGWNHSSLILFINGTLCLLWGIALAIFSSGVVPVDWNISQFGEKHPDIINAITALIATASTTHLTYTLQEILEHYSYYALVDGFTLSQLEWMQGIQELSFFTVFKFKGPKKRVWQLVWLLVYGGMSFHSASVVSVLQPSMYCYPLISFYPIFMDYYVQTTLSRPFRTIT